jgi:acetyltransferase-like isoleucine patch superfamily enzyme
MGDIHGFGYVDPTARVHDPHLSIFLNEHAIRIGAHSRVDGLVKIEGGQGVTIGEHVHIASFSHLNVGGGELVFGDHSGCSSHVVICSGMTDLMFPFVSAAEPEHHLHPLRMKTVIGHYVVIFANATILPGVTIGDMAVIAAGAVVTHDVPAGEVWAGCPARKISDRGQIIRANNHLRPSAPELDEYTTLAFGRMGVRV